MEQLGHQTEVVSLDNPGADYLSHFPFPVHPQGRLTKRYGYSSKLAHWIVANASRFDVAIIEGLWNHASIGGWQGLRRARLPYVLFTHGMLDPWFRKAYPLKHWLKQLFWVLWQGKALHDAQYVLFTCKEEQALADGVFFGPSYNAEVVSFGTADVPVFDPSYEFEFRSKLPGLGQRPYFLFLSRVHRKKGCDLLIEAFSKVCVEYPNIDLVVAGPDSEGLSAKLVALARSLGVEDRVHWPGMLQGREKWGAFYGADAFVLPSHQENFGIVVAEALACETPVLITDKVNIWREVASSGAGYVDNDTSAGVLRLLQRWLTTPKVEQAAMRTAARSGFMKHFHIETAASSLLDILQRTAEGRHDPS